MTTYKNLQLKQEGHQWQVFSAEGNPLGTITAIDGVYVAKGGYFQQVTLTTFELACECFIPELRRPADKTDVHGQIKFNL